MTIPSLPSGLYPEDYDRIEAAVMETARGRWFLLEYARRQRAAEMASLTQAVERLERRMAAADEMGAAPALAPVEPAANVVAPLEAQPCTQHISEKLQDFAWSLRERGLDERVCAEIEDLARKAV
ncbi:MAG: hypothetical protein HYZ60_08285, partial [Methylocystis sp.]|nr:hypothetical protein [Methylocystis sp.]